MKVYKGVISKLNSTLCHFPVKANCREMGEEYVFEDISFNPKQGACARRFSFDLILQFDSDLYLFVFYFK